ncbi:unnamed protein product, partial [Vitis vinifera]
MPKFRQIFLLKCLCLLLCMAGCSPPEDPIKCASKNTNCTITNSYGAFPDRSRCRASAVAYPTTEEELISVVAKAAMDRTKMKAVTRFSHSIPKLVCTDGEDGLLISTNGATLRQVIDEAAKAGLALPYAPYWWGLTIGGLLSSGAHGSSLWSKGSSVHEYVEQLRIITPAGRENGYVQVRTLDTSHEDLNAAKVSIGVLGVISQATLRLQPLFKRSIDYTTKNDSDLADQAATFGSRHEFADITWYPSQGKAVYRIDDRVPSNTSGNGLNDFTGFRSTSSLALALLRTTEENQELKGNADGKCTAAKLTTLALSRAAYGLTNNGIIFTGYPVIGYHNRLQASGTCLDSIEDARITACPWDPRVKGQFFHQTTFSIALSRASTAYLGKQEDALDFDITHYRSKDPMTPRLYEDILEEVEQMGLFKYGGLPHWAKNRNLAFDGAIKKYKNAWKFLKVKERYDPLGLFSSEWTDQVLGLKKGVTIFKKGCALEGLCICSEDSHCAPEKGYFCRPGKVYKDARVCTLSRDETYH